MTMIAHERAVSLLACTTDADDDADAGANADAVADIREPTAVRFYSRAISETGTECNRHGREAGMRSWSSNVSDRSSNIHPILIQPDTLFLALREALASLMARAGSCATLPSAQHSHASPELHAQQRQSTPPLNPCMITFSVTTSPSKGTPSRA